jgi:putative PIN family toxin of toxin-antitoxin system
MLVVLDTNVLVSGLLNGAVNPGRIVDLVIEDRLQIAYDDHILAEYEDVLARPEFHFNQGEVRAIINHIEMTGCFCPVEITTAIDIPDSEDLPFLQLLVCSDAETLITGNIRHFPRQEINGKPILTPTQFINHFFP